MTLKGLTEADMYRILTEPVSNLIRQQVELMKAENVTLSFTEGAIREIARVAFLVSFNCIARKYMYIFIMCVFWSERCL